jgi:hypothetical protein
MDTQTIPTTDIPRARERLIVARAGLAWGRLIIGGLFGRNPPTHADEAWVLTGVLVGHLSGRPLTVQGIANEIDMPRTSVNNKLYDLMQRGHVYRVDNRYYAAEHMIQASRCLDDVIDVLLDAAARLRHTHRYATSVC